MTGSHKTVRVRLPIDGLLPSSSEWRRRSECYAMIYRTIYVRAFEGSLRDQPLTKSACYSVPCRVGHPASKLSMTAKKSISHSVSSFIVRGPSAMKAGRPWTVLLLAAAQRSKLHATTCGITGLVDALLHTFRNAACSFAPWCSSFANDIVVVPAVFNAKTLSNIIVNSG